MFVSKVSRENFEGKIKYDEKLTRQKKEAISKILDYKMGEQSIRERIKKATYNMEIVNNGSKKAIHPKVLVISSFKTLYNPDGYFYRAKLYLNKSSEENAVLLNKFLDDFEYKKKSYYHSYNSFAEKTVAFFNKMFGIWK